MSHLCPKEHKWLKEKAGPPRKNPKQVRPLDWSGRQDLNLRPPGPERAPAESHCVSSAITAEQASEKTSEQEAPSLDTVASVPLVETPFGAPVVRELPPDPGPHERLLTVREVASRLGVSSAFVYKLFSESCCAACESEERFVSKLRP